MREAVWIVGHGLLGSKIESLVRTNESETDVFVWPRFSWNDPGAVRSEFAFAMASFGELVNKTGRYRIFWTAGRGVMSSSPEEIQRETDNLTTFLGVLDANENLNRATGVIGFSSSAGGVYAGSLDDVITETSAVSPRSAYGKGKLEQEELVTSMTNPSRGVLIARIASLYGPGQARTKPQGLLTHVARCMLTRKPIHIYVPFDTMRDYLHVEDAATDFMNTSTLVNNDDVITKIIASEEPATIAMIIGLFRRITRAQPLLVTGTNELGSAYPHRMRLSSCVLTKARGTRRIGLPEGIAETLAYERLAYATSGMPG
jgi:UDP-glucose 4-epimerase